MLSADYIVGLTDGEGSFSVFIRSPHKKRARYTRYYRVECHYYIKLREDELSLLRKIKKFFNCGFIYLQKDKRPNHRNCYRFEISGYQKIRDVVIPFFRKHQLYSPNKRNDFNLFCKIFELIKNRRERHFTEKELDKIRKLKSQMHK